MNAQATKKQKRLEAKVLNALEALDDCKKAVDEIDAAIKSGALDVLCDVEVNKSGELDVLMEVDWELIEFLIQFKGLRRTFFNMQHYRHAKNIYDGTTEVVKT